MAAIGGHATNKRKADVRTEPTLLLHLFVAE